MKRILLVLTVLVAACGKEDKVKPANTPTFLRYFNGGNNDVANAVVETSDNGLLILATTEITPSELVTPHFKIKLIKTDAFGNQIWQKFYPAFGDVGNYKASGMSLQADGSLAIAGTSIVNGISNAMILVVDGNGENAKNSVIASGRNVTGQAVTTNSNGEYLLVSSTPNTTSDISMNITRFSPSLDKIEFTENLGAGLPTIANKVYLDASEETVVWGGTVSKAATTGILFVKLVAAKANEGGPIDNHYLGDPVFTETGNDLVRYGDGFAYIGETDAKADQTTPGADLDILFKKVSADGTILSSQTFPLTGAGAGQNETGNSICLTREGGLLLLGTVNSQGSALGNFGNGGKDYYLIKINAFGTVEWTQLYGSKFDDNGVQVAQASDGGYLVLGTTTLANLKTIMLMKIRTDGTIQ